jgi:hypothetical protein
VEQELPTLLSYLTKGVIRSLISKNRQHNGQNDKQGSTKHTYKTKDWVTRTALKTGSELRYSGRVGSSCSTNDRLLITPLVRYDNVTLSPLVLQWGLRFGPIQRNGAAPRVIHTGRFFVLARAPPKIGKIWFFGVKSWFFTRNTPKIFAPPSARALLHYVEWDRIVTLAGAKADWGLRYRI